ncbi:MAG: histidine--tRNA ligase, partial [Leptospiraceae bacterium]|nr:histidine--tRNA ligase [Leptospiraceae bacterium]
MRMALSTKPYIGSRDFFPDDMNFRNWMFGVQRDWCRLYGYQEYAAPLIEPIELYRAKSSEEIVNEQVYRFIDRGEREVAIRPELTPTLARMAAQRLQDIPRPLRWFNVGNFMRYERPGRGRLREFYQLNVDLLGSNSAMADAEVLMLAVDILRAYGAGPEQFLVRYSDRRLLESYFSELSSDALRKVSRAIDKREKIKPEEFEQLLSEACPDTALRSRVPGFLELTVDDLQNAAEQGELDPEAAERIRGIRDILQSRGYADELRFDPGIVRGFDYYTGFIFEIYDLHPENNRALFGGGRYDRLVGLFGKEDIPAVGFGMGDVTLENFIRTHNLVPAALQASEGVYLTLMSDELKDATLQLAMELRAAGIECEAALEPTKKFGKQFELADRK